MKEKNVTQATTAEGKQRSRGTVEYRHQPTAQRPPRPTASSRVRKLTKGKTSRGRETSTFLKKRSRNQGGAFPTAPFVRVQYNDFIDDDFNEFFDHIEYLSSENEITEYNEPENSSPNLRLSDCTSNPSSSDDAGRMTALMEKAYGLPA